MNGTGLQTDPKRLRRFLRLVLETGDINGSLVDTELRHTWVHNVAPTPPEDEILGRTDTDLFPEETAEQTHRLKREAIETESRVEDTFTFLKPHGQNRYRAAAEPLYDSDGEVDGAMFAAIDISDRYQLLERATDAVYTVDSDWTITFWNQQMAERTGRPASDVLGESLWEVFGDTLPPELEQRYRTVMETRESAEFEQYLPAPYEYWVEVRVFADKDGLSIYSRDITDRKEREQELRRNREFLKQTQEVAQVGGWEVDFETGSVEWTDEVYRIHGLSPDQSGFDIDEAIAFYHPEDRETIREALDSVRTDGESYDLELRIITADDRVCWVRTRGEPLSENGEIVGARGTFQDITERKEREQRLIQQRDDLELLDQMVRHDIRNSLQLISGYAGALEEQLDGDEREYVEQIRSNTRAAVELTKSARELAEVLLQTGDSHEPVALRPVVRAQVEEARASHGNASITVAGTIPAAHVPANEMLSSVFRNLLKNAIQHNDSPVPEVVVSATTDGDTVTVRIADNGPGVPDELKDQIFGKGEQGLEGPGSGIGLYLVQTLVESYGGDVWVEDNDPTGAVFVVELPTID